MASVLEDRIEASRNRKAWTLAEVCRAAGFTAAEVADFDGSYRYAVEVMAHVRTGSSDETWRHVVGLLAGASSDPCPFCRGKVRLDYMHPGPCNH